MKKSFNKRMEKICSDSLWKTLQQRYAVNLSQGGQPVRAGAFSFNVPQFLFHLDSSSELTKLLSSVEQGLELLLLELRQVLCVER